MIISSGASIRIAIDMAYSRAVSGISSRGWLECICIVPKRCSGAVHLSLIAAAHSSAWVDARSGRGLRISSRRSAFVRRNSSVSLSLLKRREAPRRGIAAACEARAMPADTWAPREQQGGHGRG